MKNVFTKIEKAWVVKNCRTGQILNFVRYLPKDKKLIIKKIKVQKRDLIK
jgi:hypothetical protein